MLSREELNEIPLRYRWLVKLLLRLPNPSLPYFVLRRLPEMEGFFWAIVTPVFLVLYFFFSVWLVNVLSLRVVFPFNLLLGLLIPTVIFVLFLRVQLERAVHWWRNLKSPHGEWQTSKVAKELEELFKKQQEKAAKAA